MTYFLTVLMLPALAGAVGPSNKELTLIGCELSFTGYSQAIKWYHQSLETEIYRFSKTEINILFTAFERRKEDPANDILIESNAEAELLSRLNGKKIQVADVLSQKQYEEILLKGFYRFGMWIAKDYHDRYRGNSSVVLDDLIQAAMIGVINAFREYDPDSEFMFTTVAYRYVQTQMYETLRSMQGDLGNLLSKNLFLQESIVAQAVHVLGPHATVDEILAEANTTVKGEQRKSSSIHRATLIKILRRIDWKRRAAQRIFVRVTDTDSEESYLEPIPAVDVAVSEEPDPYTLAERAEAEERIIETLETTGFSDREILVIRMRFGIGLKQDYTLEQVGDTLGVTRERIRQIEAKALHMFSHPSRSNLIRDYIQAWED